MREQIYNSSIPKITSKPGRLFWQVSCACFALFLFPVSDLAAADWSAAEQQLAKKIVAVTGPGAVSLTVENRSSLGRRDGEVVQNGLRSILEQSGIQFVKSGKAAGST